MMARIIGRSDRGLTWLDDALEAYRHFPAAVRRKAGCEIVSVGHSGLGRTWEPLRGVAGAAVFSVRHANPREAAQMYRVVAATSFPDVIVFVHAAIREAGRGKAVLPQKDLGHVRARILDVALDRQERRPPESARVRQRPVTSNVFVQLGFDDEAANDLLDRAVLISELRHVLKRRVTEGHADVIARAVVEGDIDALNVESLRQLAERLRAKQGAAAW